MPGNAAIYCRISSDPEGERAGVERQRADCEALAKRLGLTVTDVYIDNDVSAYSGKTRPEFERLLSDATNGDFDVVVVWGTDRLYRRMTDLTRITDELAPHCRIASVNGGEIDLETSEGILRAQVLGSVAEFESRRKSERITARAKQRAAGGRMTASRRPFGWSWAYPCPGGSGCVHTQDCQGERPLPKLSGLVPHPVESVALAEAYQRIADGASLRGETLRLRESGLVVKNLGSVLQYPRNAGLVSHKGVLVADAADGEAIVSRELWNTVQSILADPKRRTSPNRPAGTLLGGGLLKCAVCGSNLASGRKRGNGSYICSANACVSRVREPIDNGVLELAGEIVTSLAGAGVLTMPTETNDATASLRAAVAADEARLDQLAALVAAGGLDPGDYAKAARIIRENLATATAKLAKAAKRPALAGLTGDVATAWAQRRADVDNGDVEWMRAALRELLTEITLDRDKYLRLTWREWVGPAPDVIDVRPTLDREERRTKVLELAQTGVSGVEIAKRLSVNRHTVHRDIRELIAAGTLPPDRARHG